MIGLILGLMVVGAFTAGVILLTIGFRGRPVFSQPRCARCDYDLRTMNFMAADIGRCPECGSDLNQPKAVNFGRRQRWRKMIAGGTALVLLSFLMPIGLTIYSYSVRSGFRGGPSAGLSTPALLAQLPKTVNQPWDWQELEARLQAGKLTRADVETAIVTLTAYIKAQRAQGKTQEPLSWSQSFINSAIHQGMIRSEQLQALCQAFYGADPQIQMRTRQRENQPIRANLEFNSPWRLSGQSACWALKSIVADGSMVLTPQNLYGGNPPKVVPPDWFSGSLSHTFEEVKLNQGLSPGEHELVFTFDIGVLRNPVTFRGLDGRPGTPDKWPNPITQWQTTVKKKIRVVGKDEPVVSLVTDEKENPLVGTPLEIEEAMTRPASRGVDLVIKWKDIQTILLAVSYKVQVRAGNQTISFGDFLVAPTTQGGGAYHCITDHHTVESFPAEVKTVDVLLTPDATLLVDRIGHHVERIWGQPVEIKNVPLQRFDLEPKK